MFMLSSHVYFVVVLLQGSTIDILCLLKYISFKYRTHRAGGYKFTPGAGARLASQWKTYVHAWENFGIHCGTFQFSVPWYRYRTEETSWWPRAV